MIDISRNFAYYIQFSNPAEYTEQGAVSLNLNVFTLFTTLINQATPIQLNLAIRAMELAVEGRLASVLSTDQIQGLNSILAGSKVLPTVYTYSMETGPLGNPETDPMEQLFSGGKPKPYFGPWCPEHGKVKYNQIQLKGNTPTCKINNCGMPVEGEMDLDKIKSWQFDPKAGPPTTFFEKNQEQGMADSEPQPQSKPITPPPTRSPSLAETLESLRGKHGKLRGTMLYNHLKKKGITTLGGALEYYHSGNCNSTRLKKLLENWLAIEGVL